MKRALAAFVVLVLVQFTRPDGLPVWVNPNAVAAVSASYVMGCSPLHTMIRLSTGGFQCVVEKPEDVVNRLTR